MAPAGMTTTISAGEARSRKAARTEAKLELAPPSPVEEPKKGPVYPDIKTIRDAIPEKCWNRSYVRSFGYLFRDLALISAWGWLGLTYIPQIDDTNYLRTLAWIAYGYVQGLFCTGLWILAHECGHGAFSPSQVVNDVVGWFAHSLLMVPYFSWKFSHHRHHRFTGHMEKDMVFVPRHVSEKGKRRITNLYLDPELFEDTPIVSIIKLIAHQVAGWQMYLLFNVSAGPDSKQREGAGWLRVSHFEPTSAVFRPSEAVFIALSDLGLAIVGYAVYLAAQVVGWKTMFFLYIAPYMWVHHWLGMFFFSFLCSPFPLPSVSILANSSTVAITYLHHTHPDVPHFDAESWTFVKGALATVDRDFGFVGKHLFHGIIDKHVVHHLFP